MAIAEVEAYLDAAKILPIWAELEAVAAVSVYQTRAFLVAWIETIGKSRHITPVFIVGRDEHGQAVALLCLGMERHGPFRTTSFLGGKESNFHLGLFRPNVSLTDADLRFLLRRAAKRLGRAAPHLFLLQNQPFAWDAIENPLALMPHQPSPSVAYATQLTPDGDKFLAERLSKDTRKKLRKKEARLADLGPVTLISNNDPDSAQAILKTFLAEKIARFREQHSVEAYFADPATQAFLERMSISQDGGRPWLEFYALKAGERIIATYAGAAHRGHFSCMVNSFDDDPEIAKSSPGELLLMRLIALKCDQGLAGFDLGIGEARYKATFCDRTVPLFDIIFPIGIVGRLYGAYSALLLRAKWTVKHHPRLLALVRRLRQLA
jgi:CelD/BcsL family acetyltransferase involved in cellulose biosynthesis